MLLSFLISYGRLTTSELFLMSEAVGSYMPYMQVSERGGKEGEKYPSDISTPNSIGETEYAYTYHQ